MIVYTLLTSHWLPSEHFLTYPSPIFLDLSNLSLGDSNSEHGSDMLGPLPSSGSWPNVHERHPYPAYGNVPFNPYHQNGIPSTGNHPPMPIYAGSVHSDVDSMYSFFFDDFYWFRYRMNMKKMSFNLFWGHFIN